MDSELLAHELGFYRGIVADIDGDDDLDIASSQDYNKAPVSWWENLSHNENCWEYHSIDDDRDQSQYGMMGSFSADLNGDGWQDIGAGSRIYINPKGKLGDPWQGILVAEDTDLLLAVDIDGDSQSDLLGIRDNTLVWFEAKVATLEKWVAHPVAELTTARTQGYLAGKILAGENLTILLSRKEQLLTIAVPVDDPVNKRWPSYLISSDVQEEGVAIGDIDRDGDNDILAVHKDGHHLLWFANPGELQANWPSHIVGETRMIGDRVALADFNGDGWLDVAATEESRDLLVNARLLWFEAKPDNKKVRWQPHTITTMRSINSMDVGDIDGDGDIDISVAEHTDMTSNVLLDDNLTMVFENPQRGTLFTPRLVERGKHSSHLGAKLFDVDNDGDLDLFSIGWTQYGSVHLWENRGGSNTACKPF